MTGIIDVALQTPQITYSMTLKRNITVVRGDSGSGKSYLCSLIEQASQGIEDVSMILSKPVDYLVLPRVTQDSRVSRTWQEIVKTCENTIIFIDETCDCWKSGSFSREIQGTSNYYVIFSRGVHADLPYSVDSVLYFEKTMSTLTPCINGEPLYPECKPLQKVLPLTIVTEDEKAGCVFYQHAYSIPVESAKSKTKIAKKLKSLAIAKRDDILLIVDGAAFGPEIEKVQTLLKTLFLNSHVFMPESFEWLLLHSPVFYHIPQIQSVLQDYLNQIDWSRYFSAERYFTAKLSELTSRIALEVYDKSSDSLDPIFLSPETLSTVRKFIPIDSREETSYFS